MPKSSPASRGQEPPRPQAGERLPVFAALDLGTNNCRLLIARPVAYPTRLAHNIKVLDTFSRIVRLGEGLTANGQLSPDAMSRTLSALKLCKKKLERFDIAFARYVATEACRQAANNVEFITRVKDETGISIDIISNEEEAKLAFLGCSTLLTSASENAIVFDIGGGSTEFMWVKRDDMAPAELLCEHRIMDWRSLNQGVMNLSEKFGGAAFAEVYFDELVGHMVKRLRAFDKKNKISDAVKSGGVQMLSTSGTLTTLAAIHLGLTHYERARVDGFTFAMDDLRDAVQKILGMRASERFSNPCIGVDRSDYIISGCAIFEAICTLWPVSEITIADRGVREGIILSLMQDYMREKS
jgi:exopolyphosphatase/guanosine-5'-triphosphate,3'-diphosphate pyrophosphatase